MVADEFILSTKTRNWHWNASDPPFHDLHKFFDVQYEERDAMENL
jgi:starvation-inducible DNA-binding protein